MTPMHSDKYQLVVKALQQAGVKLPPSIENSVCPKEVSSILRKFLAVGIDHSILTKAIAIAFNYPVYNVSKDGEPVKKCPQGNWLVGSNNPATFYVANPFAGLMPSQVLDRKACIEIKHIGLLPIALKTQATDLPINKAAAEKCINGWLNEAYEQNASDVHIVPLNNTTIRISFRIDGDMVTHEDKHISALTEDSIYQHISNTLMRMCNIEAGVYGKPVDGKFIFARAHTETEIRLAMRPMSVQHARTQGFFLRLLTPKSSYDFPALNKLGLAAQAYEMLVKFSQRNQNLILITGPTGSGKTTTLYSVLQLILRDQKQRSIQTLEDPIEIHFDGICQTEVHTAAGMTYFAGLRSMMRSDVDVILIGEIRDEETASLAVRAALTGHLVLATVHCKSSHEAIGRMLDLGVSPQLLAMTFGCSFAQRLVRRVCRHCADSCEIKQSQQRRYQGLFDDEHTLIPTASSCPKCNDGYSGRCLVSEALPITPHLASLIIREDHFAVNTTSVHKVTLWQHAAELIRQGLTTLKECETKLPEYIPGSRKRIALPAKRQTPLISTIVHGSGGKK